MIHFSDICFLVDCIEGMVNVFFPGKTLLSVHMIECEIITYADDTAILKREHSFVKSEDLMPTIPYIRREFSAENFGCDNGIIMIKAIVGL